MLNGESSGLSASAAISAGFSWLGKPPLAATLVINIAGQRRPRRLPCVKDFRAGSFNEFLISQIQSGPLAADAGYIKGSPVYFQSILPIWRVLGCGGDSQAGPYRNGGLVVIQLGYEGNRAVALKCIPA